MRHSEREQLFRQVFLENRERLYRLCYGYLYQKDDVEDLYQEIMINIWSNLHTFRKEANINTWVYRIAVNTTFLHNRRIKKEKNIFSSISSENAVHTAAPIIDNSEEALEIEQLRKNIARLKTQDRVIITLFLEGLTYKDISEIVGISVNYIGVKINRIKQSLQKQLREDNG